ncbi:DUF1295 domain-containing protein [Aurantiacibacter sp. D1-12]|uniref:DUF1295 domain-containing protein n=1 Tax=Aurantiacibacter sp. D1-12 TaxID=2993658 RepID=UPI00237C7E47|nr:DUF1295 domain-containing protein [Aurantiacibacter sp. D1-12]MDE1467363.1 DUF1295 domain-containing protein [Aurantiacibacter sp. D1-12]
MAEALVVNAMLLLAAALVFWLIALAIDKVSFVDAVWGGAMAGLAVASFVQVSKPGAMATLIMLMTALWGVRLARHLLLRFLRHGEDKRYVKLLSDAREEGRWGRTILIRVWLLQSVLLFMVSSPAQVGILAAGESDVMVPLAYAGIALWAVGMFFEVVGDWQLARFKADPASEGKVMDKGLWRYTRHPNYFGDACVWWGIWLAAMSVDAGAVIWTLPGPVFLTFTLVRWSGAAMTERGMKEKYGEAFASYVARTSAFVPWLPKRA